MAGPSPGGGQVVVAILGADKRDPWGRGCVLQIKEGHHSDGG